MLLRRGNQLLLLQQLQHSQRVSILQLRPRPGVDQLQGLNEKLDFANPAAAQLQVALPFLLTAQAGVDLLLHQLDIFDHAEIEVAPIDKGFQPLQKFYAERDRACHRPGLDHRRPLPALAPGFVVGLSASDRDRQVTAVAIRTQTGIDAKNKTIFGHLMQCPCHQLGQLDKVTVQTDFFSLAAAAGFAVTG